MADRVEPDEKVRYFTQVYNDFFRMPPSVLSHFDKMVFIAIKSHAGNKGSAFPSVNTIYKETGISKKWIRKSIDHLVELKFLKKEKRNDRKHNGNLYILYETEAMCKAGTEEEVKKAAEMSEEDKAIETLVRLGYTFNGKAVTSPPGAEPEQEKEPSAVGAAEGSRLNRINSSSKINSNSSHEKLQAKKISMDELRTKFDYDAMISGHPDLREDINFAMQVIYDSVNTSQDTLRIGAEAIPSSDVYDRLMDLKDTEIVECIYRVLEQSKTQKIRHSRAYLLKSLYNNYTQTFQSEMDANYDMHHLGENDKTLPEESYDIWDNC